MALDVSALETLVQEVWQSLSPLPLQRRLEPVMPLATALDVVGWVGISGAWDGVVTVRSEVDVARRLAEDMFGTETPVAEEDIADAWGELANMIGGWVKAAGDGQSILSLPTVVRGSSLLVPDGRFGAACEFDVEGGSLWVRIIERGSTVRRTRSAG